jgi:hypothetical protein
VCLKSRKTSLARITPDMPDLVVTCPAGFWAEWIAEGDAAGERCTGEEWAWFIGGRRPPIEPGERLYVAARGRLRGWAPVVRVIRREEDGRWGICCRGGAVACTLADAVPGFRGYRYPWWRREQELTFPDWRQG